MTKTWKNGDIIQAVDMNRFEDGVDELYVTITNSGRTFVMDKTYNEIKTAKRVYINGSIDSNAAASSCAFVAAYDANESQGTENYVTVTHYDPVNERMTTVVFIETNGVLTYTQAP